MSKGTIVLAHGLFGFGELLPGFQSVNYFNGIAQLLRGQDWKVVVPNVDAIGSVELRGEELANQILAQTAVGERVHIIAHSMGGLDARQALKTHADLAQRVITLVTVGTPHKGSPVADAVVNKTGPLVGLIPKILTDQFGSRTSAIQNLTTSFCADFNTRTPDLRTVRYINVAGNAPRGNNELFFFRLAAEIGGITGEINDGVVTRSSALRDGNEQLQDWPVDHLGEIGWTLATVVPFLRDKPLQQHLERYTAIAQMLERGTTMAQAG